MSDTASHSLCDDIAACVGEIQGIGSVAQILETVAMLTGLGFVAIAHVTDHSWTTCAVLDKLGLGLAVGDGLDVATTLCEEVRTTGNAIVIDHVNESKRYRDHPTPRIYGFQSYFSIPIFRPDGAYFGTLCGLDPKPAALSAPATVSTLQLFAQLISRQLEVERLHAVTSSELLNERETSELREQFIAVLGHDLRTPLGALHNGVQAIRMMHPNAPPPVLLERMERSVGRMSAMVDDVVDFTRGRMGGGIVASLRHETGLHGSFGQIISELQQLHADRRIVANVQPDLCLSCDAGRLGQLLSNLIKNAIVHGEAGKPVLVAIACASGRFTMAVTNEGETLSAAVLPHLFKPFWRPAAGGKHEGLGLGLYIVSEIARAHDGHMDVVSQGSATTFSFSMPAR